MEPRHESEFIWFINVLKSLIDSNAVVGKEGVFQISSNNNTIRAVREYEVKEVMSVLLDMLRRGGRYYSNVREFVYRLLKISDEPTQKYIFDFLSDHINLFFTSSFFSMKLYADEIVDCLCTSSSKEAFKKFCSEEDGFIGMFTKQLDKKSKIVYPFLGRVLRWEGDDLPKSLILTISGDSNLRKERVCDVCAYHQFHIAEMICSSEPRRYEDHFRVIAEFIRSLAMLAIQEEKWRKSTFDSLCELLVAMTRINVVKDVKCPSNGLVELFTSAMIYMENVLKSTTSMEGMGEDTNYENRLWKNDGLHRLVEDIKIGYYDLCVLMDVCAKNENFVLFSQEKVEEYVLMGERGFEEGRMEDIRRFVSFLKLCLEQEDGSEERRLKNRNGSDKEETLKRLTKFFIQSMTKRTTTTTNVDSFLHEFLDRHFPLLRGYVEVEDLDTYQKSYLDGLTKEYGGNKEESEHNNNNPNIPSLSERCPPLHTLTSCWDWPAIASWGKPLGSFHSTSWRCHENWGKVWFVWTWKTEGLSSLGYSNAIYHRIWTQKNPGRS